MLKLFKHIRNQETGKDLLNMLTLLLFLILMES